MYSEILNKEAEKLTNKQLIKTIKTETDRIELLDWLANLSEHIEDINKLSFDITLKNDAVYILFRFMDYSGTICKGGIKIEKDLISTLNYVLSSINKGQHAVRLLNDKLDNIRAENGIVLSLKYRWGFGKYSTIAYWDYTNLVIKFSEETIKKLTYEKTLDECTKYIENIPNSFRWTDSITEFIREYNSFELSKIISSEIGYESIEKALKDNMLSVIDIKGIIKKNSNEHGSQKLKSVYIVSELGLFAAILLWDIDYELKDISVEILDSKVIDIENSRFVSDHSLYSRIEQRILEETIKIANDFKEMASD